MIHSFNTSIFRPDVLWHGDVCPSGSPSGSPSVTVSALFSYMLWSIELKCCMSPSSYEHSIKFEYCQFRSIFRILEIHSFLHFSLTCFDILSWKFAHDFVLQYFRWSWSVVNMHHFLRVIPLLELRILEIHISPRFSLICFDILSWKFTYPFALLYYRSVCINFDRSNALFELRIPKIHSFSHFSPVLWHTELNFFIWLFNVLWIKSECHHYVSIWLSICVSIFCTFLLYALTNWVDILYLTFVSFKRFFEKSIS